MTGIRALRMAWPAVRMLRWAAAALFASAGMLKVAGHPTMVAMFGAIGAGQWFRYAVGTVELVGAAMLLVPRWARLGAIGLTGLMVGAVAVDMIVLRRAPLLSLPTLTMMAFIAWDAEHSARPHH